jgi:hypothetical protein
MDGMEVRGLMHSTTDLDVQNIHQLLTTSGDKYLPVTHATVTLYANAQFVIKQDTVIGERAAHSLQGESEPPALSPRVSYAHWIANARAHFLRMRMRGKRKRKRAGY